MWECKKCGTCCIIAGCKYYKDGLCSIYKDRPEICRVPLYMKKHHEDMLNKACDFLRKTLQNMENK